MMKKITIVLFAVVSTMVLSGCVAQPVPDQLLDNNNSSSPGAESDLVLYVFSKGGNQGYFVQFPRQASASDSAPRLIFQD